MVKRGGDRTKVPLWKKEDVPFLPEIDRFVWSGKGEEAAEEVLWQWCKRKQNVRFTPTMDFEALWRRVLLIRGAIEECVSRRVPKVFLEGKQPLKSVRKGKRVKKTVVDKTGERKPMIMRGPVKPLKNSVVWLIEELERVQAQGWKDINNIPNKEKEDLTALVANFIVILAPYRNVFTRRNDSTNDVDSLLEEARRYLANDMEWKASKNTNRR
jgi:hypothetical protein